MIDIEFQIKKKEKNFTVIDNGIFKDRALSFKAKGMLCTLLSLPETWKISIEGLSSLSTDGNTSVKSALEELHDAGYIAKHRIHKNGKIFGWRYTIYEERQTKLDESDIVLQDVENQLLGETQESGNQSACNQSACKSQLLNTNNINKYNNKELDILSNDNISPQDGDDTLVNNPKLPPRGHDLVYQNKNEKGKIESIDNNLSNEDVEDKKYTNFLKSVKKEKKPKKKSLYTQCADEVYLFTDNIELRVALINYLGFIMRLYQDEHKPFYFGNFKGLLNKLNALSNIESEQIEIVNEALSHGWRGFFKSDNKSFDNSLAKFGENMNMEVSGYTKDVREEMTDEWY